MMSEMEEDGRKKPKEEKQWREMLPDMLQLEISCNYRALALSLA